MKRLHNQRSNHLKLCMYNYFAMSKIISLHPPILSTQLPVISIYTTAGFFFQYLYKFYNSYTHTAETTVHPGAGGFVYTEMSKELKTNILSEFM